MKSNKYKAIVVITLFSVNGFSVERDPRIDSFVNRIWDRFMTMVDGTKVEKAEDMRTNLESMRDFGNQTAVESAQFFREQIAGAKSYVTGGSPDLAGYVNHVTSNNYPGGGKNFVGRGGGINSGNVHGGGTPENGRFGGIHLGQGRHVAPAPLIDPGGNKDIMKGYTKVFPGLANEVAIAAEALNQYRITHGDETSKVSLGMIQDEGVYLNLKLSPSSYNSVESIKGDLKNRGINGTIGFNPENGMLYVKIMNPWTEAGKAAPTNPLARLDYTRKLLQAGDVANFFASTLSSKLDPKLTYVHHNMDKEVFPKLRFTAAFSRLGNGDTMKRLEKLMVESNIHASKLESQGDNVYDNTSNIRLDLYPDWR